MIAISSIPIPDFQSKKSVSIGAKENNEHLIAYTAYNVKTLLECSKEKIYYQQKLLPNLFVFVKHVFRHCNLTPTILVIALIYLKRLKRALPAQSQGGKVFYFLKTCVY